MKNLIRRFIIWIVFLAFLWYLIYILVSADITITTWWTNTDYLICCILAIIWLYYLVFYAIKPTYFKWYKIVNTLIWILIIYISQTYMLNSWSEAIYYWDIFSVIWVVLTIIWPTNLLLSKEIKKDKKTEIIEVE